MSVSSLSTSRSESVSSNDNDVETKSQGGKGTSSQPKPGLKGVPDNIILFSPTAQKGDVHRVGKSQLMDDSTSTSETDDVKAAARVARPDQVEVKVDVDQAEAAKERAKSAKWAKKNAARIAAVVKSGVAEKTLWSSKYGKDQEFTALIDAHMVEWAKLQNDIDTGVITDEKDIAVRANKNAAYVLRAFGFADENGLTQQTKDDLMKAGRNFAWASVISNLIGVSPGGARYGILSGTYAVAERFGIKSDSAGLAGFLGGFSFLYFAVQAGMIAVGSLKYGAMQSGYGKIQTHIEPCFTPNVKPAEIADRDGKMIPERGVLESRIDRLEATNDPKEITAIYAEITREVHQNLDDAKKRVKKYMDKAADDPAMYASKLEIWQKTQKNLEATLQACLDDYKPDDKTKAVFHLKVQLEIVKLFHNINAAEMQGYGRAIRAILSMVVPGLSIATSAGAISWSPPVYYATLFIAQFAQAGAYALYHGSAGGLDGQGRLAMFCQIAAVTATGNFGKPGALDKKKLDAFGKAPLTLRLEGRKKITEFNAQNCVQAMLAHIADSNGNLPNGIILKHVSADLKALKTTDERIEYLTDLRKKLLFSTPPRYDKQGALIDIVGPSQKCLNLYIDHCTVLNYVDEALRPDGDASKLFSAECPLTPEEKEQLLLSLEFGANRLAPSLPGGPRTRDEEKDALLMPAELAFCEMIGDTERLEWVGSMHQGMQKLGDGFVAAVGGSVPALIQAFLSLVSSGLYFAQVGGVAEKTIKSIAAGVSIGGNGLSILSSLINTRLGWVGRKGAAVKNDIRMDQKAETGTIVNVPTFFSPWPTTVNNFAPLGGKRPPERPGMKLRIQTPGTGSDEFKRYVWVMGYPPVAWKEIWNISRETKNGQVDKVALKNIEGAKFLVMIGQLGKLNAETGSAAAMAEKFEALLRTLDVGLGELAHTNLPLFQSLWKQRARVYMEFSGKQLFARFEEEKQTASIEDVQELATDALKRVDELEFYELLKSQTAPMLMQMLESLVRSAAPNPPKAEQKQLKKLEADVHDLVERLQAESVFKAEPSTVKGAVEEEPKRTAAQQYAIKRTLALLDVLAHVVREQGSHREIAEKVAVVNCEIDEFLSKLAPNDDTCQLLRLAQSELFQQFCSRDQTEDPWFGLTPLSVAEVQTLASTAKESALHSGEQDREELKSYTIPTLDKMVTALRLGGAPEEDLEELEDDIEGLKLLFSDYDDFSKDSTDFRDYFPESSLIRGGGALLKDKESIQKAIKIQITYANLALNVKIPGAPQDLESSLDTLTKSVSELPAKDQPQFAEQLKALGDLVIRVQAREAERSAQSEASEVEATAPRKRNTKTSNMDGTADSDEDTGVTVTKVPDQVAPQARPVVKSVAPELPETEKITLTATSTTTTSTTTAHTSAKMPVGTTERARPSPAAVVAPQARPVVKSVAPELSETEKITLTATSTTTTSTTTAHTSAKMPVGATKGAQPSVQAVDFAKNLKPTRLRFYMDRVDPKGSASIASVLMHVMLDSVANSLKDGLVVNVEGLMECAKLLIGSGGNPSVATAEKESFASRLQALAKSGVNASTMHPAEKAAWQKCASYAAGLDKSVEEPKSQAQQVTSQVSSAQPKPVSQQATTTTSTTTGTSTATTPIGSATVNRTTTTRRTTDEDRNDSLLLGDNVQSPTATGSRLAYEAWSNFQVAADLQHLLGDAFQAGALHTYIGQVLNGKSKQAVKTYDGSEETLRSALTSGRAKELDSLIRTWMPQSADQVIAALNGLRKKLGLMQASASQVPTSSQVSRFKPVPNLSRSEISAAKNFDVGGLGYAMDLRNDREVRARSAGLLMHTMLDALAANIANRKSGLVTADVGAGIAQKVVKCTQVLVNAKGDPNDFGITAGMPNFSARLAQLAGLAADLPNRSAADKAAWETCFEYAVGLTT